MTTLDAQLKQVRTREDLAVFVRAMREDLRVNRGAWENVRLGEFLEGLADWLVDMDQIFMNMGEAPPDPSWPLMGLALLAAATYE